jgi:hypothetical protein
MWFDPRVHNKAIMLAAHQKCSSLSNLSLPDESSNGLPSGDYQKEHKRAKAAINRVHHARTKVEVIGA